MRLAESATIGRFVHVVTISDVQCPDDAGLVHLLHETPPRWLLFVHEVTRSDVLSPLGVPHVHVVHTRPGPRDRCRSQAFAASIAATAALRWR